MATIYSKAGTDAAISGAIAAIPAPDLSGLAPVDHGHDGLDVDQIALAGNLALTVPAGYPVGQVYRVVFTQDGTGGHTVTHGGQPVTVDTTAGAVTTVELHPAGAGYVVRYPAEAALGTAATTSAADYATAAQGVTADQSRRGITQTSRNAATARPLISIIDDDGHADVLTRLAPVLQARNVPAGVAVIGSSSSIITDPAKRAQLKALQDDHGWEVMSHTMTHRNISTIDEATYIADTEAHIALMAEYGFDVPNIVYPYGSEGTNWHITPRYYLGGFSTAANVNDRATLDAYAVARIGLGSMMAAPYETLPQFQALIDSVKLAGRWLVLMTHIYAADAAGLQLIADVVDYAIAQGVAIVKPADALREFGPVIQSGRRNKTAGQFYVRPDGLLEASRYHLTEWQDSKGEADAPMPIGPKRELTSVAVGWSVGSGWVTEMAHTEGWQRQDFRGSTGKNYTRRFTTVWKEWYELLRGVPAITYTVTARTLAAHTATDVTIFYTNFQASFTYMAAPAGTPEAGLSWNVWCHGNGAIKLRLVNNTGADLPIAERAWTIRGIA